MRSVVIILSVLTAAVAVGVLAEYRSTAMGEDETAASKKVLSGLADGSVDIVIGTHRLLQKNVRFRNLGLAPGVDGSYRQAFEVIVGVDVNSEGTSLENADPNVCVLPDVSHLDLFVDALSQALVHRIDLGAGHISRAARLRIHDGRDHHDHRPKPYDSSQHCCHLHVLDRD